MNKNWITAYGQQPLYIAGPCSAETPEQLRTTALAVQQLGIKLVRAGVWKPRTRPNSFEGVGVEALKWIQEIKKETGLAFAIEVANPLHVEAALQYDIDVLWIGARSTVNPFTVQEIADALQGTDKPVLVKNPINPDLSLWMGAFERLKGRGIDKLGAIHRGFSSFAESRYRNIPAWQIPIELKRLMPDLPLICDPSHIGGDSLMIEGISQMALDLDYDGLMIETHPTPAEAWSDAKQQVSPAQLQEILSRLRKRDPASQHPEFADKLEEIRDQIDQADREILEALHRRMELVGRIGEYKRNHNIAILDLKRWNEIFESRPQWGKKFGLKKSFIKELYKLVHQASIKMQTNILNNKKEKY
ncbi:bifunctional 3-deoxy-7-phosphoheptulonate synthase/chorismate mutase type II [Nafulsella turpanensis]|uniref:bifunctional 3-deoxy-7-phosphoheptulonate synthase/chorismate mutase type II n=1 Tax=Nafulsella turpanensis TaxID=1265690 RepID=UPI000347AC9F|nr:bifunctional 3-deoxy-7-phosphoheptulonate synthase/chorismate mutase type II [Nafulsella turpanensis]